MLWRAILTLCLGFAARNEGIFPTKLSFTLPEKELALKNYMTQKTETFSQRIDFSFMCPTPRR